MYGYGRCGVGSLPSPKLKFESMEWNTGGSRKKKFKITRTTLITIFWDIEVVMNMDCLHRGMTVSRQCHIDLFLTLQKKTSKRGNRENFVLEFFCNTIMLPYTSQVATHALCDCGFNLQPQKTFLYFADLVPRKRAWWANDILMTMS